jgi:hypothetical protein
MTTLQFLGIMQLASYGDFAKLPREIRDLIYAEYFSVDTAPTLEKHLETSKSEAILYVTEPDTSLLRASRALYWETQPVRILQKYTLHVTDVNSFGRTVVRAVDYSGSQRMSQPKS